MFLFDSSDFMIFSVIRVKSLCPGIIIPMGIPTFSWVSLTSTGYTGSMLGNAFACQEMLTWLLEAVSAACWTTILHD